MIHSKKIVTLSQNLQFEEKAIQPQHAKKLENRCKASMDIPKAKPFLKWAGGKTQLLKQFEYYYPAELKSGEITHYIEPFIGSGAVFLEIAQKYAIRAAYLSDINEDLVLAYRVIQSVPDRLIDRLEELRCQYSKLDRDQRKQFFLDVRQAFNCERIGMDYQRFSDIWIKRSAQLIFLNKTCFNGLYRLNSQGAFNVPFGKYKNPQFYDRDNILHISRLLKIAEIRVAKFESCYTIATHKSFIYFDPPYRPLTKTANFTGYSKFEFADQEQEQLARLFHRLNTEKGAKLMLSNSDPQNIDPDDNFFDTLYQGCHIHRVSATRAINSDATKRGQIRELIITNYTVDERSP